MKRKSPPRELEKAGRQLWRWLTNNYETETCEPLGIELCILHDRLADIRERLAATNLTTADRGRLIAAEVRVNGAFTRVWRTLGLADDTEPKRPPGRPPREF